MLKEIGSSSAFIRCKTWAEADFDTVASIVAEIQRTTESGPLGEHGDGAAPGGVGPGHRAQYYDTAGLRWRVASIEDAQPLSRRQAAYARICLHINFTFCAYIATLPGLFLEKALISGCDKILSDRIVRREYNVPPQHSPFRSTYAQNTLGKRGVAWRGQSAR
jgi:hypothetical protein